MSGSLPALRALSGGTTGVPGRTARRFCPLPFLTVRPRRYLGLQEDGWCCRRRLFDLPLRLPQRKLRYLIISLLPAAAGGEASIRSASDIDGDLFKTALISVRPGSSPYVPCPGHNAVNSPDLSLDTREQLYGLASRKIARLNPPFTRPGRFRAALRNDERSAAARMASRTLLLLLPSHLSTPADLFSPSHLQIAARRFPEIHAPLRLPMLVAAASEVPSRRLHADQHAGPARGPSPPKRRLSHGKTITTDLRRMALHIPGRVCFGMPRFSDWNAAKCTTTTVSALRGENLRFYRRGRQEMERCVETGCRQGVLEYSNCLMRRTTWEPLSLTRSLLICSPVSAHLQSGLCSSAVRSLLICSLVSAHLQLPGLCC
uniref:Uncharacterized protein n=1 Tax=Branchiostoma floridae TaxID=7739 RepID=C3YF76_BRAFL|eukprot:XP_002605068.1 hypothetical protein BRAFLDRAFT_85214 [Branchiostoma floridae]